MRTFKNMLKPTKRIVDEYEYITIIYHIHMNPLVIEMVNDILCNHGYIKIIELLEVLDFHNF